MVFTLLIPMLFGFMGLKILFSFVVPRVVGTVSSIRSKKLNEAAARVVGRNVRLLPFLPVDPFGNVLQLPFVQVFDFLRAFLQSRYVEAVIRITEKMLFPVKVHEPDA